MKPLLVGEANPYGGDPYFALYPEPDGCAGYRLCVKVMGLREADYLRRFDRVNLCPRDWDTKQARERASFYRVADEPKQIVLLGAKVTRAFGLEFEPFTCHVPDVPDVRRIYIVLPHPSGLSRAWHEPGAFERARVVLREAGVL